MMRKSSYALALMCVAGCVTAVQAGLWEGVWQGLDLLATPSGSPTFTNGTGFRVNGGRSGRVRWVPTGVLGDGYRLEFDRTFGNDASGRPETFPFGIGGELTLAGSTAMTAQYDQIGSRDWTRSGSLNAQLSNLNYAFRTKTGGQSVQVTGTLNASNQFTLNPFGFYEAFIDVSNENSVMQVDGVVVRDDEALNFDVGPINVRGNIFVDGLSALLTTLGVDTSGLEALFPESPMGEINEAIRKELQAAAAGGENADLAPLLLSSVLEQDEEAAEALVDQLLSEEGSAAPIDLDDTTDSGTARQDTIVPEPGTLLLVAMGATMALRRSTRLG